MRMLTWSHTHARMHTHMHTHIHTHLHTCKWTCTHTHPTHTHMHAHTLHTHIHTHTHARTHPPHTHTHTHTCTHTPPTHTYTHMHAHTLHTHTYTHTFAHTKTHTHNATSPVSTIFLPVANRKSVSSDTCGEEKIKRGANRQTGNYNVLATMCVPLVGSWCVTVSWHKQYRHLLMNQFSATVLRCCNHWILQSQWFGMNIKCITSTQEFRYNNAFLSIGTP